MVCLADTTCVAVADGIVDDSAVASWERACLKQPNWGDETEIPKSAQKHGCHMVLI
jgi:hypothetical protein